MESLKKVITLRQAAKLSGYNQDYLGSLIRAGEIKGTKVGRNWFTTVEEIRNYELKLKMRHQGYAVREFFSSKVRIRRIVGVALLLCLLCGLLTLRDSSTVASMREARSALSAEAEIFEK